MPFKTRLKALYPEAIAETTNRQIQDLVDSYTSSIPSARHELSQADIVLICYADHVQSTGLSPLQTLWRFLESHVAGAINSVHILPFYPYSSDDGFSVIDYCQVDPNAGAWQDIMELAKNYRLMFDAVINHISQESSWFQGYLAGDEQFADYFVACPAEQDNLAVVRPRTLPLLTTFTTASGQEKHIWTTFSADQVDLNYRNPAVLLAVLEVLLFYLAQGARLLRLDAIAFLWKEPGTSCIHLPQTHEVIKLVRAVLSAVAPATIIITETNVPHEENVSYFGNGNDEAHLVYNFTLPPLLAHSMIQGNSTKLTNWAQSLSLPSDQVCFFNFTASHDGVGLRPVEGILTSGEITSLADTAQAHGGFVSFKRNEDDSQSPYELNCNYMDLLTDPNASDSLRVKRLLVSQAIMLAMPGVPGIYFHSLVGSSNDVEGVKRSGRYRSINREKLDYETLMSELQDDGSIRDQVFSALKSLLQIRKSDSAFHPFGGFEFPGLGDEVFAAVRLAPDKNRTVIAIHNLTDRDVTVTPQTNSRSFTDLVSGQELALSEITLRPYQFMWLVVGEK